MRIRTCVLLAAAALVPSLASAQSAPAADAFRDYAKDIGKNLMAASELMPADKYDFKPTPAQMSFGNIMGHLSNGNDLLCSAIGGRPAPTRSKVAGDKEALVQRLKETFHFCDEALEHLDDAGIGEQLPLFGGKKLSRAAIETLAVGDWADHYSQVAIYLRLNNLLPPTAKK